MSEEMVGSQTVLSAFKLNSHMEEVRLSAGTTKSAASDTSLSPETVAVML